MGAPVHSASFSFATLFFMFFYIFIGKKNWNLWMKKDKQLPPYPKYIWCEWNDRKFRAVRILNAERI
jgi:hypothetical protein